MKIGAQPSAAAGLPEAKNPHHGSLSAQCEQSETKLPEDTGNSVQASNNGATRSRPDCTKYRPEAAREKGTKTLARLFIERADRHCSNIRRLHSDRNREARRFEQLTEDTIRFIEEIERVASAPVSLISTRFDSRSIIDRRSW